MSNNNWGDGTSGFIGTDCKISCSDLPFQLELLDISPPAAEAKSIDMTHMGSTDFKEYIPGKIIEWGDCEFEVAWDPNIHPDLLNTTNEDSVWTIVFPTPDDIGYYWKFKGYISNIGVQVPLEDRITANITIQVADWVSDGAGDGTGS